MGWQPWKSNSRKVVKSLQEEVTKNIDLLRAGQVLMTAAWDAIVQGRQLDLLGDAAYAAQVTYGGVAGANEALQCYQQRFFNGGQGQPPAPGERESYEAFLAQQRAGLAEKLTTLQKDLAHIVS